MNFNLIQFYVVILMMIFAVINDVRTKQIKNIIPSSFFIISIILNIFFKNINFLYSFLLSLSYFIILYYIPKSFNIEDFMGAGDIKLYMVISFLLGWKSSIYIFIYSIILGSLLILILNISRLKNISLNVTLFFSGVLSGSENKVFFDENKLEKNIFSPYILLGVIVFFLYRVDWLSNIF